MMILSDYGSFAAVLACQSWAMERLIYVHVSGDLRWAMLSLVSGSLVRGLRARAATVCPAGRDGPQAG